METRHLNNFIKQVGDSVHAMNTIAVALSRLPDSGEVEIPEGLDISWKPNNLSISKAMSRNYAVRSSYVYAAESLFEYLDSITKNPFWNYPEISYSESSDKKAIRVYNILMQVPKMEQSLATICELMCHWRNRIVHEATSNADLSSKKKQFLQGQKNSLYNNFHHFDIDQAIDNFNNKQITLKDASTMITMTIKCVRLVDEYFFHGMTELSDFDSVYAKLEKYSDFVRITTQSNSTKKTRQLIRWIEINFPFLSNELKTKIMAKNN
jgi:hypothetical protein